MKSMSTAVIAAAALFSFGVASVDAQERLSSRHGADDQAGASNLITPDKIKQASGLIKQGKVYPLARTYESKMPLFGARVFALRATSGLAGGPAGDNKVIWNDDFLATEIGQVGTQFDGLGHIGIRTPEGDRYYNNVKGEELHGHAGLEKLGIEHVKPFFTRGVLVNLEAYKGKMLDLGYEVTVDDIKGALQKQGFDAETIGSGDVVLLHTGWGSLWGKENARFSSGEPGIGLEAGRWLASKGIAVVGADTWAVEVVPNPDSKLAFVVHQELIARNGIFLHENVATERLAADGVTEFAYSFAPMPIKGATGAPGNALAIR
jgi:kynurenine formamidase